MSSAEHRFDKNMDDKNMEQQWRVLDRNTRYVPPAIYLFVTNLLSDAFGTGELSCLITAQSDCRRYWLT